MVGSDGLIRQRISFSQEFLSITLEVRAWLNEVSKPSSLNHKSDNSDLVNE